MMWQAVNPTRLIIQEAGMALNTQEWTIGPLQMMPDFFLVDAVLVATKGTGAHHEGGGTSSGKPPTIRILLFLIT